MSKVKKKKTFGDTTSFTIPATGKFTDIQTGQEKSVTPEMLRAINEHLDSRTLGNAIMTLLFEHVHGRGKQEEYERLEGKIDKVLEILQQGVTVAAEQQPETSSVIDIPDDADDLLSEHFG
jgi:hypothetical protein